MRSDSAFEAAITAEIAQSDNYHKASAFPDESMAELESNQSDGTQSQTSQTRYRIENPWQLKHHYESRDGGRGFRGRGFRGRYRSNRFERRREEFEAQRAEAMNDYVTFKEKITAVEEAFLAALPEEDDKLNPEARLKMIEEAAAKDSNEETKDGEKEAERIKHLKFLHRLIKENELDRELNF